MSKPDLDAIQERADAATEGPWFREYSDVVTAHPDPRDVEEGYDDARNTRVVRGAAHLPKKDRRGIADADFIAHARTDVPALLALVREQQARIERVEVIVGEYMVDYSDGIEIHYADLARLRAALIATEAAG